MADQQQVAVKTPVTVERAGRFNGGAELVIRTDQRERSRSREQLGIGSWSEEFVGIERV